MSEDVLAPVLVDFAGLDYRGNLVLVAANAARKEVTIRNDTDYDIPISYGSTTTATLYGDVLPRGGRYVTNSKSAISGFFSYVPEGRIVVSERLA